MSSDDQKQERGTATTTRTDTGETSEDVLTTEEERVVRARHGLSEEDDHELKFALGASEEAKAKMAKLESFLLEAFQEREKGKVYFSDVEAEDVAADDPEAKNKIVDALSDED